MKYRKMARTTCERYCTQNHPKTSVIISIKTSWDKECPKIYCDKKNNVQDILFLSFDDTEDYRYGMQESDGVKVAHLIPIQIIVTKELELEEHISLRMLSDNVTEKNAKRFVETASLLIEKDDRANADAILQISVSANKTIYDKVKEEEAMCDALRDLMKDEIEEEVKEKTTKAVVEERISIIRTQMKNLKWSAEKVMESMGIPKSEYPNYMKML